MIYVALLRGINVGGNNMVSMKELQANFERLRFENVRTYINSGNVLFTFTGRDPRSIEDRIDRMLSREFGLKGKTVVRTQAEMARLVKTIDREWKPDPAWKCNVIFLRHTVDPKRALADLELKADVERVVCCPGTLLWSARISAMGRSAMMKLGRTPLYQEMTVRNVNTTKKLLELMRSGARSQSSS
jgi:uncharacterized protein (DUF1697 family)